MGRRTSLALALAAVLAVGLVGAWVLLAPTALGGGASYLVVEGSSMAPGLGAGDLVVARERDSYAVGNVVAYRSSDLDAVVLHRIVAVRGSEYSFQGDANEFVDADRPTADRLVGELWFSVPAVGTALAWIREPRHAAVLAGLAALLVLLGGTAAATRTRRGNAEPTGSTGTRRREPGPLELPPGLRTIVIALGALAALSIALAAVAFSRPVQERTSVADAYTQSGAFSYEGPARQGSAYPDGRVSSGQPVYRRLASAVDVGFDYRLDVPPGSQVRGTVAVRAVLADPNGWTRTIAVVAPEAFEGPDVAVSGPLDLRSLDRLVTSFERETGTRNGGYTVTLEAEVSVAGRAGTTSLEPTRFPMELPFRLDPLGLVPLADPEGDPPPLEAGAPVGATRVEPSTIEGLWLELTVEQARVLSIAALALALAGLAAAAFAARRRDRRDEPSRIAAAHGELLVEVTALPELEIVVDVATVDALARMARGGDRVVLHAREGGTHVYGVEAGGLLFRYVAHDERDAAVARVLAELTGSTGR